MTDAYTDEPFPGNATAEADATRRELINALFVANRRSALTRIVTGSDDKTARLWDAASGAEIAVEWNARYPDLEQTEIDALATLRGRATPASVWVDDAGRVRKAAAS